MVTPIAPIAPMEVLLLIAVSLLIVHLQYIDSQQNNNHYAFTLGIHPTHLWHTGILV